MTLFPKRLFPKMEVISIVGMAGIGKSTFVKNIFEDPLILHHFKHHVWVTLGPKYNSEDILVDILAQVYPDIDKMHVKSDPKLAKDLCAQLSDKRCLIVLDDLWKKEPLQYLEILFPEINGKALVTTRLQKFDQFEKFDRVHEMRLLNKEESWDLLCLKVFVEELCPPELEKAGRKIAENCDGLPLLIVTVANFLFKAEKTQEYWDKVAEKKNSIFIDAQNEISLKALYVSYQSLPQRLKICFLYMGVFPQNYEISSSKLLKLWIGEGFLESNPSQTIENFAMECLLELINRSVVMVCKKSSNFKTKTCRLHSVFWHLSNSEAVKNKFFHAFNTYADNSVEGTESQHRLCIRKGILLGNKDVHNSMASCSATHSLLCFGPYHQYPVPIHLGLRLLRVLDALTIRFYQFPIEIVRLIHLKYLALTCNEKLPPCISKLWNLQFLIISRHLSIKSSRYYLPMEIWDMKELKHLQISGSELPNPNCGVVLPNLLTLLDVSAHSCTTQVFEGIPNLKRLGIQIELPPDHYDDKPFHCLNHISCLSGLESLKFVVVNPELRSKFVVMPASFSIFPLGLKKLTLSGLGYSWQCMSIIGKLQDLEVLKLRSYAFRGPEWELDDFEFEKLKYLLIEDTDLVRWKVKLHNFWALAHLSIGHCYKLEELPLYLSDSIEMIEVVDCNPVVETWAKKMEETGHLKESRTDVYLKAHVRSPWADGKPQFANTSMFKKAERRFRS